MDWCSDGLRKPAEVEQTNSAWRKDMDQVGRFVDENCLVGQGEVKANHLYGSYQKWAESGGEKAMSGRAFVGAGTVLSVEDAKAVQSAGGELIISPNVNVDVIAETKKLGLMSLPGFFLGKLMHPPKTVLKQFNLVLRASCSLMQGSLSRDLFRNFSGAQP